VEPTSANIFLAVLVAFGMIAALVGTILPAFPGVGLAWLAALVFGFLAGWSPLAVGFMVAITLTTAAALGLGVVVPKRATDAAGASRRATWAGLAGAIIGFFAIPVVGFVIGGAAGVYLAEFGISKNHAVAWMSTKGTLKGFGIAALIQVGAVLAIGVLWLVWAFLEFTM
jgi:uncharacterized protein YqgC (DUF456 family)